MVIDQLSVRVLGQWPSKNGRIDTVAPNVFSILVLLEEDNIDVFWII